MVVTVKNLTDVFVLRLYHRKPRLSPHPAFARARLNYPLQYGRMETEARNSHTLS